MDRLLIRIPSSPVRSLFYVVEKLHNKTQTQPRGPQVLVCIWLWRWGESNPRPEPFAECILRA